MAACALAAVRALSPILDPDYLVPFLMVVLLSAWFGGRAAGLLAAGLTAAALLLPSGESVSAARFATYLLSAVIIAYLAGELRSIGARWEATLCSMADGVVVIDQMGRVKFLNPAAEAITGWKSRDARRKPLEEVVQLIDEKSGEHSTLLAKAILEGGQTIRATRPKTMVCRDGHKVWVEESSAPVRGERGLVVGGILVFRDVTARREVQDQVNQSQRMDAVGRLAGGVAGDFNDLLTVMTGYSEMLRTDLDAGDHRRRFADEIYQAADRAAGLTRQLTALGNKQPGPMKVLDLSALIGSMETMLRRVLGNQIDLMIVAGSGKVRVDSAQIEQVMVNLAMNSRDAMPQGGKFVIEIGIAEIDANHSDKWPGVKPGNYITMAVSDTGIGMDAETRSHLFEPFFTTKPKEKGTGLGLSIVYGIIQQSRGYINVYSQLGAGTIFEIFLPRDKSTGEILLAGPARKSKRGSETILIVDDEERVRKLVHAILATNGYKVLEARDGVEALALHEANRKKVEMVVTDVMMPNMTGLDLGARLRVLNPSLPILYVSGYQHPSAATAEQAFLFKPFTPEALLTQVRELLDRPAAAPAPTADQSGPSR
jgi:two-component system cell cycle sensor histidine kinase/response regulator CckA